MHGAPRYPGYSSLSAYLSVMFLFESAHAPELFAGCHSSAFGAHDIVFIIMKV